MHIHFIKHVSINGYAENLTVLFVAKMYEKKDAVKTKKMKHVVTAVMVQMGLCILILVLYYSPLILVRVQGNDLHTLDLPQIQFHLSFWCKYFVVEKMDNPDSSSGSVGSCYDIRIKFTSNGIAIVFKIKVHRGCRTGKPCFSCMLENNHIFPARI